MTKKLIDHNIQYYRTQIDEMVKDLHDLTIRIDSEELSKTVSDLRNRIHEPFMFVIVGEVKAGKSSFINALLATGEEVTKVAPQPMTDTIQQILYGETEEEITVNPYLKQILLPVDILQEIAIVDTPGTNTIIEHHQEITENFIPASDLIVFVFEAKNPYRQSAWNFFDYIHADWRKKIIFVLQQKDLLPEADLAVNLAGVNEYAQKKGIDDPQVFAVSAKQEQEGDLENSGFGKVRAYIQQNITGGKAPILKLGSTVETSININERIQQGLADRRRQWQADVDFRKDILETLDKQEQKSAKQVEVLVENLLAAYDRITRRKGEELAQGLSFFTLLRRSLASIFSKKQSAREWLDGLAAGLEAELNQELSKRLDEGVGDLADSIQQMAQMIDLKIKNSTTILRKDHDIFSDIAERRSNVLRDLQDTFARFLNRTENFTDDALFPDKQALPADVATGSGLAVIGIILAAVTQGIPFDITGGLLTAVGLVFAGVSTRVKRKKIIDGYHTEIANSRDRLEEEVKEKLLTYIRRLKKRIDQNFEDFDQMLDREKEAVSALEKQQERIEERLESIRAELHPG